MTVLNVGRASMNVIVGQKIGREIGESTVRTLPLSSLTAPTSKLILDTTLRYY